MLISILFNPSTNPRNQDFARLVSDKLSSFGAPSIINPTIDQLRDSDLVIAVGGDGTVLYASNLIATYSIPLLGINFGHRGFLCQTDKQNFGSVVPLLLEKRFAVVEKTRILAQIKKRDSTPTLEALNEIAIGGINRTVHLEVRIKSPDRIISTNVVGDGIIISTQTGSTAYNLNAGGPMLLADALCLVANNSYFESEDLLPITKSIISPLETIIEVCDLSHNPANSPFVIADGLNSINLGHEDLITIKKSSCSSLFVVFD